MVALARAALLAASLLLLAACAAKPTPIPTSTSFPTPVANFTGDWSRLVGDFGLLRVRTSVVPHNATTNATEPHPSSCTAPFTYALDAGNRTLHASKGAVALHPYDPGNLTVVFLHDLVLGPKCILSAIYGLNDGAPPPNVCLWGRPRSEQAVARPWRCHLPVEPYNDVHALAWVNVSIDVDRATAGHYRVDVNGHEFGAFQNATFTSWVADPNRAKVYEVKVEVQGLGVWPYASVRRS